MKQAVMTAPGCIEFRDVPAPTARAGEVLLRVRRIGICGSDVHVYHGRHPYTSYPVVQGHEFCGLVEAVGEGVSGLPLGAKATALPQVVCGACPPCLRGDEHICDRLKVEGFQAPGVAQELFAVPAGRVVVLPENFSFEQGALVEPAAVACHAVARAGDLAGRNVAVLGAGPIGNLTAQVARAAGARVVVGDLSDDRLGVARACGIEHVFHAGKTSLAAAAAAAFGAGGFDAGFECAGASAAVNALIQSIAKAGTIVVVAVYGDRPATDLGLVQDHELTLTGTLMYRKADYDRAVEAIAAGRILTDPLVSRHFAFAEYMEAYRFIEDSGPRAMKVFIDL
jgi:2-desacetyl-2-hydroxyethyl bacteriochlorophyllide A dehydrogenase